MESIYASRTFQRARSIAKPILAVVLTPLLGWLWFELASAHHWIQTRTNADDVRAALVAAGLPTVQANAFHASTLVDLQVKQLASIWPHLVLMESELIVYRRYSRLAADPAKRAVLIDQAHDFYLREFEAQLVQRPNNPAEAVRLAMLAAWTPGGP